MTELYRTGDRLTTSNLEAAEMEISHGYGELQSAVVVPIGEYSNLAVCSPESGAISELDIRLAEVLGVCARAVLDRLNREAHPREERDPLNRLLSTSPAAIVLLDGDGNFVCVNERIEEVVGIGKDEVTERAFSDPEQEITAVDGRHVPDKYLPRQVLRRRTGKIGALYATQQLLRARS